MFLIFLFHQVLSQYCPRLLENALIQVNPLNFIDATFQPTSNELPSGAIQNANQYETIYTLQAFSFTQISFDLRHMYDYPDVNGNITFNYSKKDWEILITLNDNIMTLPTIFQDVKVDKFTSFTFSLFVYNESNLSLKIGITLDKFEPVKYEFMNTTKIFNIQSNRAIMNTSNIFIFEITSSDGIALPANILPLNSEYNYLDYIISFSDSNYFVQNNYTQYSPQVKYWGSRSSVVLPYIPYFSNCQGFGQYIYLYQLTQHDNCTLIDQDQTIPINPFIFGMQSNSDVCEQLQLRCILDEKYNINPRLPRWFELDTAKTIFTMSSESIAIQYITDDYQISSDQIVQILTENSVPKGMMPLEVALTLNYYQITQSTKIIISGTVSFNNFYKLSSDQQSSKDPIEYNLIFNFIPMNQGQLVNSFALEWPVYFILYLIIGALLVMELIVFLLYHYILNRKRPRPEIKLFVYIKTFWPSSVYGILLAFIPVMFLYILISLFMGGKIWTVDLSYGCDLSGNSESDSGCAKVFFDIFKNNLKYTDSQFVKIRDSRCGVSMIICGFYLAIVVSGIFLSDKSKSNTEIYNGNVQNDRLWKRSRFIYSSTLISTLMLILIQFSFTTIFSENAYVFLIFNKVSSMIIEYIMEVHFDNNLLLSPISIIISIFINVATMGNSTFYDFLLSTFVDKGVEMVERAYIIKIQDLVTKELEEQYEKIFRMLKRLLDEDEELDMDDEKLLSEKRILKTDQDNNDTDSDIVVPDDYQENWASDDESVISQKQSSGQVYQNSSFTKDDQDEFEQKFQQMLVEQLKKKYNTHEETVNVKLEESRDESDQTDMLDYFSNFGNDIITLLYYPFITITMWLFYEESHLLESYSIKQSEFIYYFLWAIIQIPFQIIIDVLGYNLVEQYHELEFLSYINHTQTRFKNRRLFWKADENDIAINVENCFKPLDQWCYSSQFYFITTLYVAALQLIIFGAHIIYMNQYNIFEDLALVFIALFWTLICYIIQKLTIFIGNKLGIWRISNRIFPDEVNQVFMTSIEELDDKSVTSQGPLLPILLIENWNQAIEYREQIERLSEINNNLDREQFQNEQFRKIFVNSNKQWLKDNIKSILTPRTLKTYRKQILDQFTVIYGPQEKKNEEDPVAGFDNAWNVSRTFNKRNTVLTTVKSQQIIRKNTLIPEHVKAIFKYWYYRNKHQKTAIRYVGGLLEKITKPFCDYCGLNWGLGVDTEVRIEDLYLRFLKLRNLQCIAKDKGNDIDDWQNFFPKQCKFRTTCFICNVFMVDELVKETQQKQQLEEIRLQKLKKKKYTFKQISRIVLIWIKYFDQLKKK